MNCTLYNCYDDDNKKLIKKKYSFVLLYYNQY